MTWKKSGNFSRTKSRACSQKGHRCSLGMTIIDHDREHGKGLTEHVDARMRMDVSVQKRDIRVGSEPTVHLLLQLAWRLISQLEILENLNLHGSHGFLLKTKGWFAFKTLEGFLLFLQKKSPKRLNLPYIFIVALFNCLVNSCRTTICKVCNKCAYV